MKPEKIIEMLRPVLPEKWESVDFFSNFNTTSYEFFYFVNVENKKYQCYKLESVFGITREQVESAFEEIYEYALKDYRKDIYGYYFSFDSKNNVGKTHKITKEDFGFVDWLQIYNK